MHNIDEEEYLPVLVQLTAAVQPSPFEHIITRLTRLKLQKPTQAMDTASATVFLEDLAEMLEQDGFCYAAIDEGITSLIKNEKEKFFPTYERLRHYIFPINYQLTRRATKLEEMLLRKHEVKQ